MSYSANYFIKSGNEFSIHYHHSGAYSLAVDLYTGEGRFIEFVRKCNTSEYFLGQKWLEGAVLIDLDERKLYFWTRHFTIHTSVMDMYVLELEKRWSDWRVVHCKKHMEDMEVVLGIDYISHQEPSVPVEVDRDNIVLDKIDELDNTLVIICVDGRLISTTTGELFLADLLAFGKEIVDILLNKASEHVPAERDCNACDVMLINLDKREVVIAPYLFGIRELYGNKWEGFTLSSADHGYPGILSLLDVDIVHLLMPPYVVREQMQELEKLDESLVSVGNADQIPDEPNHKGFHSHSFDSGEPGMTFMEKLKTNLKKWFNS